MVRTHAKAIDDVPPQGVFARRNAAHEAAKQEAKEAQQRKRDAATALENERAARRQAVRDAVAEDDLSKTLIAEAAEINRVHLYTYLKDDTA